MEQRMKILLTSTPRSGNTWLRLMLANLYQLEQYAVHTPDDLNWSQLPQRCIVQLHWDRTSEFTALLAKEEFDVLTIARHPLDVLLSILHFCTYEPATSSWLAGRDGGEELIKGKEVASKDFYEYATSPRAAALLSVTPQWWCEKEGLKVRYEQLVQDPQKSLSQIIDKFGDPLNSFEKVLPLLSMDELRKTSSNNHFWKGSPGHWKNLMPENLVNLLGTAHSGVFGQLGYDWRFSD